MTQLALLLALSLTGIALSFGFGRMEASRGSVSATVKRIEGAIERAGLSALRVSAGRTLALLLLPALGLVSFALWGASGTTVSSGGRAAFMALALLAGAATALFQARLALAFGARAASSAAQAIARGSARGIRPLLRSAAALSVFGDGLGVIGVAAAFAGLYAIRGGFAAADSNAELAREIVELLPAFALGAALTALMQARDGSLVATAARVGSNQVSEQARTIEAGESRDPALLATLVGQGVGELMPRVLLGYVSGLTATVSVALLAATSAAGATLSSLVLLLLVRAFGVIASLCGVLAARVSDDESPLRALVRGQLCATLVSLFGLGAATFWQARDHVGAQLLAGAAGLLSALLLSLTAWLPLRRGSSVQRELGDAQQAGDAAAIVRGASAGLSGLLPALLIPSLTLAALEHWLGPEAHAPVLAITFTAGALALAPFAQAFGGFGLLAGHARGIATLARIDAEPRRRTSKLDDLATLGDTIGATHLSLAVVASVLLGLLTFSRGSAASPGLVGSALVAGATLVLVAGARALRAGLIGARLVAQEAEKQLTSLPRQGGGATSPADFTPSYKACVDAALEAARGSSTVDAHALVVSPFLLGALASVLAPEAKSEPLFVFALAALLSGLVFALGGRASRAALGELRRRLRSTDNGGRAATGLQSEAFGELIGVGAAASVEALALVLALTILCLAPLIS